MDFIVPSTHEDYVLLPNTFLEINLRKALKEDEFLIVHYSDIPHMEIDIA